MLDTSHRRVQQVADLKEDLAKFELPILVSSGNHDIGHIPTDETVNDYKKDFGDDYYSFDV